MKFLRKTKSKRHLFEFECSHCGANGTVGVPEKSKKVFGHGCGALFIQRPATGMYGEPSLVEINPKEAA